MKKPVCTLPFEYEDTPERRVLNLESDGIYCVPALGFSQYRKSRPSVSEHLHPGCMEITLCMRGALAFECEQTSYRLLPDNIFVTQPDEWHRLSTNPKGLVMYWMFFRLENKQRSLLHLPPAESDKLKTMLATLPHKLFPATPRLRSAFQRLFKLYDELSPGTFRTLSLRGTVLELLLALVEAAQQLPVEPGDERIEHLIAQMREHPENNYTPDFMTRQTCLSESRLNTRFKQLTGYPPYAFLLSCRLQKSLILLQEPDRSITDIALDLGFSTPQHFSMQFKREFNTTPTTWRKNLTPHCDD